MISSYPSLFTIGHKAIPEDYFDHEMIVQEKVDGSQFSAQFKNGAWEYRSRGQQVFKETAAKLFKPVVRHFESLGTDILAKVLPKYIFRGEAFESAKSNTLRYNRAPKGNLVLFDVEEEGTQKFLQPSEVAFWAGYLGVDPVPTLTIGKVTVAELSKFLEQESFLGGVKMEGVVCKPKAYDRFGPDKKLIIARLVRDEFKELNNKEFKAGNPTRKDLVANLIEKYKSEARWQKAIQHLREEGKLTETMKDTGLILKEIKDDLQKEEGDAIKEALYKHFMDEILRGATRGFPEWLKTQIPTVQSND